MNIEAIKKLAKKLRRLRHEEHYNQGWWASRTSCGTAACLAGHAVLMAGDKVVPSSSNEYWPYCVVGGAEMEIQDRAAQVLGLDSDTPLFSSEVEDDWPEEFAERWRRRARTPKGIAAGKERPSRIAADFLDALAEGRVKL